MTICIINFKTDKPLLKNSYCGEYTDLETNTIYLRNRNYNPSSGRFGTEEPIRDGNNWYTYCTNNPVLNYDPTGTMNYLTQGWLLIAGQGKGALKELRAMSIVGVFDTMDSICATARGMLSGDITVAMLVEAGLDDIVDDFVYLQENLYVLDYDSKVSNQQVLDYGERMFNCEYTIANAIMSGKVAYDALRKTKFGEAMLGATKSVNIKVNVDIRKFTEYIFKDGAAPGKDVVFKNLGYGIGDSELLVKIYQEQATAKFTSGNYTLGKLDDFGQRIDIEIELKGIGDAAGKTSYLKSGWMINSDGSIKLNTPFSGFTK